MLPHPSSTTTTTTWLNSSFFSRLSGFHFDNSEIQASTLSRDLITFWTWSSTAAFQRWIRTICTTQTKEAFPTFPWRCWETHRVTIVTRETRLTILLRGEMSRGKRKEGYKEKEKENCGNIVAAMRKNNRYNFILYNAGSVLLLIYKLPL